MRFDIIRKIPELKGKINFSNAHIFYNKLAKFAKKLPPDTELFLHTSGISGNTFCVASMKVIDEELLKKGGRLVVTDLGNILKDVMILNGVKRFL